MSKFQFYAERPVGEYRKSDPLFIVSILLLWGIGLFTLFITSTASGQRLKDDMNYFVIRQLCWSAIGFGLMVATAIVPMRLIRKYVPYIVIGSLVLCLLVAILGSALNGASRWFTVGKFLSFQPSELAKFAAVIFLGNFFAKEKDIEDKKDRTDIYPLIGIFVFAGAIAAQRDLSTALLVVCAGLAVFFVVNAKMLLFVLCLVLAGMGGVLLIGSEGYRLRRILAWLKPEEYTQDAAFQLLASKSVIHESGIWGNGMGSGLKKVFLIPEVQSDYVFSGFVSALGLIGVVIYLGLLAFFCWRALKICLTTPNAFAAYSSFGCVALIVLQSLLNIGVVSGAFPTTGINLPFFSAGGSSLVITFIMCGFIINTSHCEADDEFMDSSFISKNNNIIDSLVVEYE